MDVKKLLITGSNGLLGQKLVHQTALRNDLDVLATSRGANRISTTEGYTYQELDITSSEEINRVFEAFQPDVVINTAAMTNVDACESDKEGCWKLNVDAVDYLIEASRKHDTHLIHLSTDFIFDGEGGPYREEDTPNPLSYYGQSKYEAEQRMINSGLTKWSIARTIIVYGIAENMSRSNIVLWAKGALEKGTPLNIVDDQFRAPTLAEDLASGCLAIADRGAEGIYHLSGPESMSILELVKQVAKSFDLDASTISPIKSATLNQAAKRPARTGFIIDKAREKLGYAPHSFADGLSALARQL